MSTKEIINTKSWDEYYFDLLEHVASRSKDPNTKVGAIIVDKNNKQISMGYNGFPAGLREYEERWEKPEKYKWVVHAEMNAIFNADTSIKGCKIYLPFWPCEKCILGIAAAGIDVVCVKGDYYKNEVAQTVFDECKIRLVDYQLGEFSC